MKPTLLAPLIALALSAGCGGQAETGQSPPPSPPPDAAAVVRPDGPPPKLEMAGPPPAWVETAGGSYWLAYSSYCWGSVCADYVTPECGSPHASEVRVSRGEAITFHLDFDPRTVGFRYVDGSEGEPTPMTAERESDWEVKRSGAALLWTTAKGGRDASYALCLRFEAEQVSAVVEGGVTGEVTVTGSLLVDGKEARLCSALAESFPPQCGEPSLVVKNLDRSEFPGLSREGDVVWTDRPVELTGTVAGGELTVTDGG